MNNTKTSIVEQLPFGLYVWEMPDGKWVGDDDGNFMNISSAKGDRANIEKLRDAARSYGIFEGKPVFLSGNTRVTDEEYSEQRDRLRQGYIPDRWDLGNMIDEAKNARKH